MRTLALLAALLLLASQARALMLGGRADKDSALDHHGHGDQDVPVSLAGEERLVRAAAENKPKKICRCSRGYLCRNSEYEKGTCTISGRVYRLCCK